MLPLISDIPIFIDLTLDVVIVAIFFILKPYLESKSDYFRKITLQLDGLIRKRTTFASRNIKILRRKDAIEFASFHIVDPVLDSDPLEVYNSF